MNTSLGDIWIERLTRKYLDDELAAAQQSVKHTLPWMEWCRADLTRGELEAMFVSIEEAWEQGNTMLSPYSIRRQMHSSERLASIESARWRKLPTRFRRSLAVDRIVVPSRRYLGRPKSDGWFLSVN